MFVLSRMTTDSLLSAAIASPHGILPSPKAACCWRCGVAGLALCIVVLWTLCPFKHSSAPGSVKQWVGIAVTAAATNGLRKPSLQDTRETPYLRRPGVPEASDPKRPAPSQSEFHTRPTQNVFVWDLGLG